MDNAGFMQAVKHHPRLVREGDQWEFLVDGKPFLIRGGELGNSIATNLDALEAIWPKLFSQNLNTVLVPAYWELCEPDEDTFDFTLLQATLEGARRHGLRLVLLWFGAFKNGMSSYAPGWVKRDWKRFPRVRSKKGVPMESLSPFSRATLDADSRAFRALMAWLRDADEREQTVILVQVENEVATIDQVRDFSAEAESAFQHDVPRELMVALDSEASCRPELVAAYQSAGAHRSGSWQKVFGPSLFTQELFMAWHYARYLDEVALAGKEEYLLPMFTNAALNPAGKAPGEYPSAGPLPHLFDAWQRGAPSLDFLAPDIYFDDFEHWCEQYATAKNPLFIPEVHRTSEAAVLALYAIGRHDALGFSPFAIDEEADPQRAPLSKAYASLAELEPELFEARRKRRTAAILLDETREAEQVRLGELNITCTHEASWRYGAGFGQRPRPRAGALFVGIDDDEFLVVGTGLLLTFPEEANAQVGIERVTIERRREGRWQVVETSNGDQTHQGRHVHLPMGNYDVRRVRVYRYR